ncbi:hypothetical protein LY56_01365 [Roseinatronobacter thiooxidans]|uniref:Uncharacterized protein n=2 Tax=Roseinatronobacter thiooxidans TaxID=121821 RepID=A0A2W7QAX8_9RHOB|nr:hypothetical protein [Roseinatronobacter thiooxidans]PZX45804.1 hypothetical protein LY56_01365 [Roseinatronobacter thiooxidans]
MRWHMDHATIFLAGVYLLPLAGVSFVSAWAHGHKPVFATALLLLGAALIAGVGIDRPEGLYHLSEIPDLTVQFVARVAALL